MACWLRAWAASSRVDLSAVLFLRLLTLDLKPRLKVFQSSLQDLPMIVYR